MNTNRKKQLKQEKRVRDNMLAVVGGFALLVILVIGAYSVYGQTSSATPMTCSQLGSSLSGIAIPSGDVCDVVLVRKTPTIMGHDGMNLNKFTLMNSVVEFLMNPGTGITTATSTNTNLNSNTNSSMTSTSTYVMGDFAVLETEMNEVLRLLKQYGWTVTGVHNHMIGETPKLSFIHWETRGDAKNIVDRINTIVDTATTIRTGGTGTTTTTPPASQTTTPTTTPPSGTVSLAVMKHVCPANIDSRSDLAGQNPHQVCPTVLRTGDSPASGATGGGTFGFAFILRTRVTGSTVVTSTATPQLMHQSMCITSNDCRDMSHYVWQNIPRGDITITEQPIATNTRFGFATIEGMSSVLTSEGDGVVNLDTRQATSSAVMVHIYDFRM